MKTLIIIKKNVRRIKYINYIFIINFKHMEDLELNFKFLYPAIVWDIKKSERYVQIFYIYQKRAWYQKVRPIHSEKIYTDDKRFVQAVRLQKGDVLYLEFGGDSPIQEMKKLPFWERIKNRVFSLCYRREKC